MGVGRVRSSSDGAAFPVVVSVAFGALFAPFVRSIIAITAKPKRTLPWKTGRFLYPSGLFNTMGSALLYAPPSEITGIDIHSSEPGPSGLSLITISVRRNAGTDEFVLFGSEANVPRAAIAEFLQPSQPATTESPTGYRDSPRNDGLFSPKTLARAGTSAPPKKSIVMRYAIMAGVFATMAMWLLVLPLTSLHAAQVEHNTYALRATASAFPFPWIVSRVHTAIDDGFREADHAIDLQITTEHRDAFHKVLQWEKSHEQSTLYVALEAPYTEMQAATAWLKAHSPPDSNPTDVLIGYSAPSLMGRVPGDDVWVSCVANVLRPVIDGALVQVESVGKSDVANAPRLLVHSHMHPEGMMFGDGAMPFASLAFDFDVDLVIPDAEPIALARAIHVKAPFEVSVSQFVFKGEQPRELGSLGVFDSMSVYANEFTSASEQASHTLQVSLVTPPAK
jgi:hypothetical protein